MISDKERREVAQMLRNIALYEHGTPSDWWMRLHEAVTDEDDFPAPAETVSAIAELIEPQPIDGSGTAQKQRDAIVTLKTLNSFQAISCTEAVNVMEAAFGVDGIHELLAKLISVLEGGKL